MSEFLLIVPDGWTELDWQYITNNLADMSQSNVLNWITTNQYEYIEAALKGAELIPAESTIVEVTLINDEFFLVRLG